jgi:hypothetical protein
MHASVLLQHPASAGAIALRFLPWYFLEMPGRIVRSFIEYVRTLMEIFSFWFLIKTFFKPWKSIVDKYPSKGFNIGLIAQAFTLNCTSRIIGMIFRTVAFVIGVLAEIVVCVIFLGMLTVWLFFPILLVLDLLYIVGTFT